MPLCSSISLTLTKPKQSKRDTNNGCSVRCDRDPRNPRYPWFYGYAALLRDERHQARAWLQKAAESAHPWFPVERLNARMILAAETASHGELMQARQHLGLAKTLLTQAQDDFEVAVNRWMGPWLDATTRLLHEGTPNEITVPRFGC